MNNRRRKDPNNVTLDNIVHSYVILALAVGEPLADIADFADRPVSEISRMARIPANQTLIENLRDSLLDTEQGRLRPDSDGLPLMLNALTTLPTTAALANCIILIHKHKGFYEPSMLVALRNTIRSQLDAPLEPPYYPFPDDPAVNAA